MERFFEELPPLDENTVDKARSEPPVLFSLSGLQLRRFVQSHRAVQGHYSATGASLCPLFGQFQPWHPWSALSRVRFSRVKAFARLLYAFNRHFLARGYCVVFLTRARSQQPFERSLANESFLSLLQLRADGLVEVADAHLAQVRQSLLAAHGSADRLLRLEFTTVFDYLQLLRGVSVELQSCGRHAAFFLAAAVSDFYVPWSELPEHKIQSRGGKGAASRLEQTLELHLQPVPKMLGELSRVWAPQAFVVSFKLETDELLLLPKAVAALERYGVHAVVANELSSRTERVTLVTRSTAGEVVAKPIYRECTAEIESHIVQAVAAAHEQFRSM